MTLTEALPLAVLASSLVPGLIIFALPESRIRLPMRPGVIKIGFGTGGRFSPGLGPAYHSRAYTPLHNMLVDPDALSPIMGFPAFADMVVKVSKVTA